MDELENRELQHRNADASEHEPASLQCSLARDRSRRERTGKASARAELLAKLKRSKETGERFTAEVNEEEKDIYELVDESQYSDIVRKRQDDNWIIDDGTGYVEDGREIFDDDLIDDEVHASKAKAKKRDPNIRKPGSAPKDLKSLFAASAAKAKPKPKPKTVVPQHDAILDDLIAEFDQGPSEVRSAPVTGPAIGCKQQLSLFSTRSNIVTHQPKPRKKEPLPLIPNQPVLKAQASEQTVITGSQDDCRDIETDMTIMESQESSALSPTDDKFEDFYDMDDTELMDANERETDSASFEKTPIVFADSWLSNESEVSIIANPEPQVETTRLPLISNGKGQDIFRFYWLDAYEDFFKHPGTVYMFGKARTPHGNFVSCCIMIKNIYRRVFILPREKKFDVKNNCELDEPVRFVDVYQEFNEDIASSFKIKNFKSRGVKKQYAFELPNVPTSAEYLEVRYGCEYPSLPKDLKGSTFSRIFGANSSSLEMVLLEQKIKGPCWLDIVNPSSSSQPFSWCKLEVVVQDFNSISPCTAEHLAAPPLVIMSLSVRGHLNAKTHQTEVVQVACLINNEYYVDKPVPGKHFHDHFMAITKPADRVFPYDFEMCAKSDGKQYNMEVQPSERALLGFLLAKIHQVDPDILIGHDISGFELETLLNRVAFNKVPHWHKIGRLRRSGDIPRRSSGKSMHIESRSATCGRIVCDIMISAKELLRCRSYDLTELVDQILHQKRKELEAEQLIASYSQTSDLLQVVNLGLQDAFYSLKIMFELNVLPLAWQITSVCGNVLSRTLLGGRSERNEFLLLHAFTEKGFVVPDKTYGKDTKALKSNVDLDVEETGAMVDVKGRRKPAYAGGLVLEPKKGFYDTYILLLDFNSLYPSIIQEYNVCFTTVSRGASVAGADEQSFIPDIPDASLLSGILPGEIRKLVESRRQVKALMKDTNATPEQLMQYDIRQKALKLTANSMYGCLGFTHSRFYAKPLAALITAKGREILQKTVDMVEKQGLDVIYGDTDSIMINTHTRCLDEVYKLGNKVKAEVNKMYRLLEIEVDGVFKSMLLLKKKKYAALSVTKTADGSYTTHQELKGLDIIRRDWCELAKQTGLYVVQEILSGEPKDTILDNIHSKLVEVRDAVHKNEIPLNLYHITKQLTKAPEAYPDKKNLPHVQVALRVNSAATKKLRAGDTVFYIICQNGTALPASQRAYHPDELQKNEALRVDTEYYLAQQVHPVVSRLCEPISGTDSALIAERLGLDASHYAHKAASENAKMEEEAYSLLSEEEKYRHCERLDIVCQNRSCGKKNLIDAPFLGVGKDRVPSWQYCSTLRPDGLHAHELHLVPREKGEPDGTALQRDIAMLKNLLTRAIRQHVTQYYQGWLRCEDSVCAYRTRRVPLQIHKGKPICRQCGKAAMLQEYTDWMLYNQLCFYAFLFDKEKLPAKGLLNADMCILYDHIERFIKDRLDMSAYGNVDLQKLFRGLFSAA